MQVGPATVSTTLTVGASTGTYGSPTTVTGTLVNNYTNTPVPGETVTLKLNGTQLHGHDECLRGGDVHHYAVRARRLLHVERVLRR